MAKSIKVFGAALDPNDDPMKIIAKCAYINRLAQGLIDPEKDFLDPYDGLLKYSKVLQEDRFIKMGKFPIESWVTPRPNVDDYHKLDPRGFQEFTNSGTIGEYSIKMEGFIRDNILPDIPLMIGVDHSLTGGVLGALSEEYGAENILVIIFDAHFDAIPASISKKLAEYVKEHEEEVKTLIPITLDLEDIKEIEINDTYTCASFLDHIISDKIILPENVILFGNQDYPNEKLKSINDPRVQQYVDYYLDFEKKGLKIIPANNKPELMTKQLNELLSQMSKPYVYVSLDVDVCMFKEVLAARFMNAIGIDKDIVIEAISKIKNYMETINSTLIGLDIMEIETMVLHKELKKSGKVDQTIQLIDEFLAIIES